MQQVLLTLNAHQKEKLLEMRDELQGSLGLNSKLSLSDAVVQKLGLNRPLKKAPIIDQEPVSVEAKENPL